MAKGTFDLEDYASQLKQISKMGSISSILGMLPGADKLKAQPGGDPGERAHRLRLAALLTDKDELKRVLADPKLRVEVPPGMPIGSAEDEAF